MPSDEERERPIRHPLTLLDRFRLKRIFLCRVACFFRDLQQGSVVHWGRVMEEREIAQGFGLCNCQSDYVTNVTSSKKTYCWLKRLVAQSISQARVQNSSSTMSFFPADPLESENLSSSSYTLSRDNVRTMTIPFVKATRYAEGSSSKKHTSTKLDPPKVTAGRVPKRLRLRVSDTATTGMIEDSLRRIMSQPTFPNHLFVHQSVSDGDSNLCGPIVSERSLVEWEASASAGPSGEVGVSHYLKGALFDPLNQILRHLCPETETRIWEVIGIGHTGKTDWGFVINNKLVLVVEIKPHVVRPSF